MRHTTRGKAASGGKERGFDGSGTPDVAIAEKNNRAPSRLGSVLLGALLALMLVVGTCVATLGIRAEWERETEPEPIKVTTTVRRTTLRHNATGRLEASSHGKITVRATGTVTRNGLVAGAEAAEGNVIGTIDERPVLLMQGDVPAYRTMAPNMSGTDVRQLQAALGRLGYVSYDEAGTYGESTALALYHFMRNLGFATVDASGAELASADWKNSAIPQGQVVFASQLPLRAVTTCGIAGQQVQDKLCGMETVARDYMVGFLKVDVPDVTVLAGKEATILLGEPATVTLGGSCASPQNAVGDDLEGGASTGASASSLSDSASERQVEDRTWVCLADARGVSLPVDPGETMVTVTLGASAENTFVTDVVALRGDGTSRWLEQRNGERVDVKMGFCYQGECEISGENLKEGMVVIVPTDGSSAGAAGEVSAADGTGTAGDVSQ
ncbi:peptidoglycan-binding domain-containing protein [Bifidobacterium oedipodis]|uniref:Tat pathway signal protein n=1 Tax=Bifidobacterium oedipodis TaxID=2675322 RepID=A0A7Y0ERM9_9BIFI|nr:peptidoglycan-binding domain-containing protein [Bifidobacterium sp. DSM 109957]NMM94708.1 Tat pathway signal protein [Bifidobacterium sp. DSM 109957]